MSLILQFWVAGAQPYYPCWLNCKEIEHVTMFLTLSIVQENESIRLFPFMFLYNGLMMNFTWVKDSCQIVNICKKSVLHVIENVVVEHLSFTPIRMPHIKTRRNWVYRLFPCITKCTMNTSRCHCFCPSDGPDQMMYIYGIPAAWWNSF